MLPIEILNNIFKYAGIRMILPFQQYLYPHTIKKMLAEVSDEELFTNNAIKLIKLADRAYDWNYISSLPLQDETIIHFAYQLNWDILQEYHVLSDNIIYQFEEMIDWRKVKTLYNISNILIKQICKLDWTDRRYYIRLYVNDFETELYDDIYKIIGKFCKRNDWYTNGGIYIDKYKLDLISCHIASVLNRFVSPITDDYETITVEYAQYVLKRDVNWSIISNRKVRSPEFLYKYRNILDWNIISKYSCPTEELLIKFYDYYNWKIVCKKCLSNSFIKTYKYKF